MRFKEEATVTLCIIGRKTTVKNGLKCSKKKNMIQVGVIEDEKNILRYLAEFINMQADLVCRALYNDATSFIAAIDQWEDLDVLILDINLPSMLGIDAIAPIKERLPDLEIIMFTIHNDSEKVFKALQMGATGYLLKQTPLVDIASAIREQHAGGASSLSPQVARLIVNHLSGNGSRQRRKDPKTALAKILRPRELEVLELLVEGLSYKMVAAELHVSTGTVAVHVRNIYKALQVNSKAEAIKYYHRILR